MAAVDHVQKSTESEIPSLAKDKLSLEELNDKLDTLWIAYLNHLDAYASAQKTFQTHLRSGHLSLARANFESRNGVRKYGQDYYHDRAIATRRFSISIREGEPTSILHVIKWTPPETDGSDESDSPVEVERTGEKEEDVTQLPTPPGTPGTPQPESESTDQHEHRKSETTNPSDGDPNKPNTKNGKRPKTSPPKLPLESDPLRWFGILVPGSLCSAQSSFAAAVEQAVAESVNAAKGMRGVEVEIRRVRKEIRRAEKESSAAG